MPHDKDGTLDLTNVAPKDITTVADTEFQVEINQTFQTISHFYSRQDLFPSLPSISHVQQVGIGDCFLLAALHSIISIEPLKIEGMMRDLRGGWVVVRLFDKGGQPVYYKLEKTCLVRKTGTFSTSNLQAHGAFWVYMLEKAYAVFRLKVEKHQLIPKKWIKDEESGRLTQVSQPKRDAITYIEALTGGFSENAIQTMLGGETLRHEIHQDDRASAAVTNLRCIVGQRNDQDMLQDAAAAFKEIFDKDQGAIDDFLSKFGAMKTFAFDQLTLPGKTVRREKVADFLDQHYGTLQLNTRTKLNTYIDNTLPGKRGTGKYTQYQLELCSTIQRALGAKSYVAIGSGTNLGRNPGKINTTNEQQVKGLAGPHAYHVSEVIHDDKEGLYYFKIRNPWLNYVRQYDWKTVTIGTVNVRVLTAMEKQQLEANRKVTGDLGAVGSGEFLLELSDLTKRFRNLMIGTDPDKAMINTVQLQSFGN